MLGKYVDLLQVGQFSVRDIIIMLHIGFWIIVCVSNLHHNIHTSALFLIASSLRGPFKIKPG